MLSVWSQASRHDPYVCPGIGLASSRRSVARWLQSFARLRCCSFPSRLLLLGWRSHSSSRIESLLWVLRRGRVGWVEDSNPSVTSLEHHG
jgi:hypothetical protein